MRASTATTLAGLVLAIASASASAGDGLRDGSFADASKGDWQYTAFSDSFDFRVEVLAEAKTDRAAFLRLELVRIPPNTNPDTFPDLPAMLIQRDIEMGACGSANVFVLRFDYRATAVTGFDALQARLSVTDGQSDDAAEIKLLGTDVATAESDPLLGWRTAEVAVEFDPSPGSTELVFEVEFTVLGWGADEAGQGFCGVAYPVIDLDQVELFKATLPGDPVPNHGQICGDSFAGMVGVSTSLVPLVTMPESETKIESNFNHRVVSPFEDIVCGDPGPFGSACLHHLPVIDEPYEPATRWCQADLDGDGIVNGLDLAILLGDWGSSDSVADINCDGVVDGADLPMVLAGWGFCNPTEGLIAPPDL